MANVDPNQSPLHQIFETYDIATKLKDEADNFWQAMSKVKDAAIKLSGNCHALQQQAGLVTECASNLVQEGAQPSQAQSSQSMADRLKR